ncbi:Gfo/Idh/MocA family oxidoreductase [Nakamurella aerolata]|uniref:Gfo/Idh/MocA family oxidoreductase n=1 Tax=Nakamurella aerolata TaxID=1656892 RepID=A0A849A6W2_9ACTN|nr:Gfo/Idh/MocA family oxidoreductase [Nakamurella aerolata]
MTDPCVPTTPLTAAVLSAGGWSQTAHLPALLSDPGCQVVAVSSPDPVARQRIGQLPGMPPPVADWRAALAREPDVVVVSSPPAAHLDMATAALRRGADVLVEKPFAPNAAQAAALRDTAAAAGRRLLVGFGWPATPLFAAAGELLASGRLGRIEQLVCHLAVGIGELLSTGPATYTDPEISAGGTLAVSMSHQLGMIDWLLGGIDAETVAAQTFPPPEPAPGAAVRPWIDRHAALTLTRADGGQLVLTSSATLPDRPAPHWRLDIAGSSGQLSLDSGPLTGPSPATASRAATPADAGTPGPADSGTADTAATTDGWLGELRSAVRPVGSVRPVRPQASPQVQPHAQNAVQRHQRPDVRDEPPPVVHQQWLPSAYDPTVPTLALLRAARGAPVPDYLDADRAVTVCALTDAAYRSAATGGRPVRP